MIARPATPDDLPAIRAVAAAHGDVFEEGRPDHVGHELAHGQLAVAQDEETIVGYGGELNRSGVSYLADLFVHPDRLGLGAGSAIMRQLYPDPAMGQRFTYASSDPRAISLYVRFGMRPLTPLLYLVGDPTASGRLPEPSVRLVPGDERDMVALDASAFGRPRPQDLEFLVARGSQFLVAMDGASPVGYGFVRQAPHGGVDAALLNPTGAMDPQGLTVTVFALLRHAAGLAPAIYVGLLGEFPGLAEVLAAGFRIHDRDSYMATRPDLVDGTRYAPSPVIG